MTMILQSCLELRKQTSLESFAKSRCRMKVPDVRRNLVPDTWTADGEGALPELGGGWLVWLSGVVVSALGMRTQRPRFESRVAPLFHRVAATLGKLFTHIASPVSQLQETGVCTKGSFRRLSGYGD